ncbi:MAG TPA: hypothetical protein PKC30_13160 [Saprospiraceae bacterium]|nr:hypothetical protein [Saprospiraceae bacterium]
MKINFLLAFNTFVICMGHSINILGQSSFPFSHTGVWVGVLEIYNGKERTMEIPMKLEITETPASDTFQYVLVYGVDSPNEDRRDYILIIEDKKKGTYIIDEQNTIFLGLRQFNNKLISHFQVGSNQISYIYTLHSDEIDLEVWVLPKETDFESGGGQMPVVRNFEALAYQRAKLKKEHVRE